MKIRFGSNDVIDTKNIEGGGADVSELEGRVDAIEEAPIYTVELTAEEVAYIKGFVDVCSAADRGNGIGFASSSLTEGYSAVTFTNEVQ